MTGFRRRPGMWCAVALALFGLFGSPGPSALAAQSSGQASGQAPGSLGSGLLERMSGSGDRAQAGAGTSTDASAGAEEAGPPPLPQVSELIPRVVGLSEDADRAIDDIEAIGDTAELEPQVESLGAVQQEVAARLAEATSRDYVRDERVQAILEQALALQGQIDEAMSAASDRVGNMDSLRSAWQEKRAFWQRWREELRADPQYRETYSEQLTRADHEIDRVLRAANRALPTLVDIQQRLQTVDAASRKEVESAQQLLRTWRQNLFRRTAPPLLSAAFREEIRTRLAENPLSGLGTAWGESPPSPRNGLVLLLQITLALLLGWALRRLHRKVPAASRWASVLEHPWAVGVLVAVTGLGFLYGLLPPLGRFALGVAVAVSVALVGIGMFDNRYKRWTVALISVAYVLFAALGAVALPVPFQRLVLAALAIGGGVALLVLARGSSRSRWRSQRWFPAALRIGALALGGVLAAELTGYHALSQWLLEASVTTAFIGFVATFLVRLGRGGIAYLVRSSGTLHASSLGRVGDILSERLLFLLQVVVVGAALLYLSVVWNLAESIGQAWHAVVGLGVTVGSTRFTVGRLLLAGLAVYLAVAASWILRSLLDRAVFEHRRFDRGVRDSIATLLHYTLVVIGVFAALSLFGVDLSSLALIAGALSVGIGFGLQNVVNNFVSGLILLFERPVRVGDVVVVGDEQGTITKIGMRSTVLTTFNGAELIVPNADLISEKVVNWTLSTPRARLVLPVSAAYGTDPERVIQVLEEVGKGYSLALDDPPPMAIFTGFGDSSLDFELRVWLEAFEQQLQARSDLAAAITRRFAAEGLEIPFPQRDLHLRSVDQGVPRTWRGSDD